MQKKNSGKSNLKEFKSANKKETPESENSDGEHKDSKVSETEKMDIEKRADEAFSDPKLLKQMESLKQNAKDAKYLKALKPDEVLSGVNSGIVNVLKSFNLSMHVITLNVIRVGEVMNILKKVVRKGKKSWLVYAEENIPNISARTCQKWMLVSRCQVSKKYAYLGLERLYHVVNARKNVSDEDPVGPFLRKYEIEFKSEQEIEPSVEKFKIDVNTALELERAEKEGINLNPAMVRGIVGEKGKLTDEVWDSLKQAMIVKGDPNIELERIFAGGGPDKTPKGGGNLVPIEKILSDIIAIKKSVIEKKAHIEEVEIDSIELLIKELEELRDLLITV